MAVQRKWNSVKVEGYVDIAEKADPGNPASGFLRLYAEADGKLYIRNDSGLEIEVGAATGGGGGGGFATKFLLMGA